MPRRQQTPEVTVVEKPLPVSLEDMYSGVTKKMKIKRKTYDDSTGKQLVQDRILEVPIKKGLKSGSKIKFNGVGDQVEGGVQDLHFIVEEVSHSGVIKSRRRQNSVLTSNYRRITRSSSVMATIFDTTLTSTSRKPCLLYTSPSPRDGLLSRMPSSA